MTFHAILFYSFATFLMGAAIGVIVSRNPVHAVMFLVLAFFQSAMLWILIEAEFLAIVLVLVYVGAVMVLFLFVVMMLDINVETVRKGLTRYVPLGIGVALIMAFELVQLIWMRSRVGPSIIVVSEAMVTAKAAPVGASNGCALGRTSCSRRLYCPSAERSQAARRACNTRISGSPGI